MEEENLTYEQAAEELAKINEKIKGDEISIDDLATNVERAAKLTTYCAKKLSVTEQKIQEVVKKLGL